MTSRVEPGGGERAGAGPAFTVVRDLFETLAAIDRGDALLLTEPGSLDLLGVGFWAAVTDIARERRPNAAFRLIADCGGAPGWALACLREGLDGVALDPVDPRSRKARAIAEQMGAMVVDLAADRASSPDGPD